MRKGFTLIELLIVLAIVGSLISFSIMGIVSFRNALEYSNSVNQVISDIKLTQQLACTSYQPCRIDFEPSKNTYTISKAGKVYRNIKAGGNTQFSGKVYFEFLRSGDTSVGGSGTLVINGSQRPKKIVVSQRGRIRVE